jgi:hypothetical protein
LQGRVLSGSSESRKLAVIRWRIAVLAARRLPRGTTRVFRYSYPFGEPRRDLSGRPCYV